jgi:thiamine-monophosphate kinase
VLPVGGGKLVVKTDMLVERTDVPPGMTYRQASRKAVAACVSDFASKGVQPDSFLVSLGLRRGTTRKQVEGLAQGLRDPEEEWGCRLVGGDTNEAGELVVDCSMLGFAKRVVGRSGAKAGDLLVVTGRFGYQAAGLKIIVDGARAERTFRAKATDSVFNPMPDLKVGMALSRFLTSGMDSSDGLARSIHSLARASGVGFEVAKLPEAEGVPGFAEANGLSAEKLVLAGGEEYVVVGTLKRRKLEAARRAVRRAGGELIVIGRASKEKGSVILQSKGSARPVPDEGWTHLS